MPLVCVANIGGVSSAGMYTFCEKQCQSAKSPVRKTESFEPWEQFRCDQDFRWVYCDPLRKTKNV